MYEINYRLISSYLFFSNIFYFYYKKYYLYSILFANLLISSVILHWIEFDFNYMTNEIKFVKDIDKINVSLVILYGTYIYFRKIFTKKNNFILSALVVYFLILCAFLWNYGYLKNRYCFDKNKIKSGQYHSLMHISGILGHLLIVYI